jgi:copper resistance protein C
MNRRGLVTFAGTVAAAASASQAFALRGRAFIDHAVPGVGLTVSGPVREVRLYFGLGVLTASVQVTRSTGTMIPVSRPFIDSSGQQIVVVRFGHALRPGTYRVSWQVISISRRSTSGTFHFTIS